MKLVVKKGDGFKYYWAKPAPKEGDLFNVDRCGVIHQGQRYRSKYDFDLNWELETTEEVVLARKWLSENLTKVKYYPAEMYSYMLKHVVEENTGRYLTNGQCIVIMRELGYNLEVQDLNCLFNAIFKPQVTRKHGTINPRLLKVYKRSIPALSHLDAPLPYPKVIKKTQKELWAEFKKADEEKKAASLEL